MEQFTDQSLVEETRNGSRLAFDELMRRHERLIYRISISFTRNREDAMDVTQDIFLKVFAKLHTYRSSGSFRSWLLRIAYRENLNWLRDHRSFRGAEELHPGSLPPSAATQEDDLVAQERRLQLADALVKLNPKQRMAVVLRYNEQMPIREIAAVLKSSEGTTRNLLCRSLQKLRQHLLAQWKEDPA